MTPINVALGIVGIAVVGSLPPSGYQIFLIVLTALMLPVKVRGCCGGSCWLCRGWGAEAGGVVCVRVVH